MVICWGTFSTKSKKALKIGWLITAGLVAFYEGFVQPRERYGGIAAERSRGLAATTGSWTPASLWRQAHIVPRMAERTHVDRGVIGCARRCQSKKRRHDDLHRRR